MGGKGKRGKGKGGEETISPPFLSHFKRWLYSEQIKMMMMMSTMTVTTMSTLNNNNSEFI